jgi:hypothetical protein
MLYDKAISTYIGSYLQYNDLSSPTNRATRSTPVDGCPFVQGWWDDYPRGSDDRMGFYDL